MSSSADRSADSGRARYRDGLSGDGLHGQDGSDLTGVLTSASPRSAAGV